jgi:hypothetical protein
MHFFLNPPLPCHFAPVLGLHFVIFGLTHLSWLHTFMLPGKSEAHNTKQNWQAVLSLQTISVAMHSVFSSCNVDYLHLFKQ